MHVCVSVWAYAHEYSIHGGKKRASDFLELELQVVACCPTWILGTVFGSSVRAAGTFNLCIISPASRVKLLILYPLPGNLLSKALSSLCYLEYDRLPVPFNGV